MVADQGAGTTRMLAEYIAAPWGGAPDAALRIAGQAFLDTVGCALAGAGEPSVTRLRAALGPLHGPATVIVGGNAGAEGGANAGTVQAGTVQAALLNGTAAHALDYDDVDDLLIGHPSAVLVPAALAVGEVVAASGVRAAEAYWRGLTTMRSVAAGLDVGGHYAKGWHSTSTLGVLGATATAAALWELSAEQVCQAIGIAVSRAAGSRGNFGSMTKPLHAGAAAADGVLAASLAREGFTSSAGIEGDYGFLALYGGPDGTSGAGGGSGEPGADGSWGQSATDRILEALASPRLDALNVKLMPCCYATHAPAAAALELAAQGLRASEVERVGVAVPESGLRPLIGRLPGTGLEGKFSLEYVIACCLADGRPTLALFTDAAVARPDLRDLASRVTARESMAGRRSGTLAFQADVTVELRGGGVRTARCAAPPGHIDRPAGIDEVLAKFDDCLTFGGIPDGAELRERLATLADQPDLRTLLR